MWNNWNEGTDIFADFFWEGNDSQQPKKGDELKNPPVSDNKIETVYTDKDLFLEDSQKNTPEIIKVTDDTVTVTYPENNNSSNIIGTNNVSNESFLELFSWWEDSKTEINTSENEATIWEDISWSYLWNNTDEIKTTVEEEIDLQTFSGNKKETNQNIAVAEDTDDIILGKKETANIPSSVDDDLSSIFTPNVSEKEIESVKKENGNTWFETMFSSKKEVNIPEETVIPIEEKNKENIPVKTNLTDKLNIDTKKKAILWIVILVLIIIWGAYSYFWKTTTDNDWKTTTWTNSWITTDIVDVNSKISDDEAIKKVLDEYKSKWLAEDLKKTNLEIKDIKVLEDFNWYKEANVKFILVQYQPILTDEAITSFLVDINKATQEQVKQIKDSWKFEQVKILMTQYYEKQYGELLKLWTLWVLYKKWEWDYTIMKMWDYFKEKFYNTWVYDIKTKTMMDFIASYISYDKTYFWKDKDKVLQLSNLVMEQLKTEDWKKFLTSVNSYFFAK